MGKFWFIVLIAVAFDGLARAGDCDKASIQWKAIEAHSCDWNGDKKVDRLVLETASNEECEGLDQPTRLRILLSGKQPFEDEWRGLFNIGFKIRARGIKNKINSSRLALFNLSAKSKTFLFVTADCGSSAPCWDRVYGLTEDRVQLLFNDLDIEEVMDVNGDGTVELLGQREERTQPCGPDNAYLNYSPILVYAFNPNGAPAFAFNEDLSKNENKKRGYPWAGEKPLPAGEALVFTDPKTKALRLVWREEADKLNLKGFCY